MTGNLLIDSAISLGVIAVLVLAARLAFRAPSPPLDVARASERLAFDEPDFAPTRWLVDAGGRAALAEGANGDFAVVCRLGIDLVTRRFPAGAAAVKTEANGIVVVPPGAGGPAAHINAGETAEWVRKLAGE